MFSSVGISVIILLSSLPLVKNSGNILMQSAPKGVDLDDVKHDLEKIPGIESIHELHIWRLDQRKTIASAHIIVSNNEVADFMERARTISECLHAYDIHSATLQPELAAAGSKRVPPRAINRPYDPATTENQNGHATQKLGLLAAMLSNQWIEGSTALQPHPTRHRTRWDETGDDRLPSRTVPSHGPAVPPGVCAMVSYDPR
ncbi:hypothetical protein DL769_010180 [Monosporascus sp. CRB-8-3]|nr:hypothetical protein DL769_010180 [Monosporascus sp. CRB-8-3]